MRKWAWRLSLFIPGSNEISNIFKCQRKAKVQGWIGSWLMRDKCPRWKGAQPGNLFGEAFSLQNGWIFKVSKCANVYVSTEICKQNYFQNKGGGGFQGCLELFQNFIYFGEHTLPLVTILKLGSCENLILKYFELKLSNICNFLRVTQSENSFKQCRR